jgi:hypothetical protein
LVDGGGHDDEPPEVTLGDVVVVVGAVVVVVLDCDSGETSPDDVLVVVEVVDVDGVVPVLTDVPLAPGCSLATTTPMSAVAPAAASATVLVSSFRRALARCRVSREGGSVGRGMKGAFLSWAAPIRSSSIRLSRRTP